MNVMGSYVPFLVAEASTTAGSVDLLLVGLLAVTVLFSAIVCIAIVYLTVKYRRGSKVDRSNPPSEGLAIEILWTAIPTAIALGLYVWSTVVYFNNIRVPRNAMQIYVVGKQWMWKLQHPEGRWEMDELHVPIGRPIELIMTSEDVIHSFFVPAFRLKQDVVPGRYSHIWFQATRLGSYHFFCAQYCGTNHSSMVGTVTVMTPTDYARWLRTGNYQGSMAAAGERIFMRSGCSGCHGENSSVNAPLLNGIYGKPVAVQIPPPGLPLSQLDRVPATTVIVDDRYIHDCILTPQKVIPAGYKPIMPTFQGRLKEEEILELIAYIKSLALTNGTSNGGSRGDFTGPLTQEDIQARTGFVPKNIKQIESSSRNNHVNNGLRAAPGSNGAANPTAGAATPGRRAAPLTGGTPGRGAIGGHLQGTGPTGISLNGAVPNGRNPSTSKERTTP